MHRHTPPSGRPVTSNCASQYYPADPNDFSTWVQTDAWYDANVGNVSPGRSRTLRVDTSRNGQGPWTPPAGTAGPTRRSGVIRQVVAWACARPRSTGNPLADAFLWVKTPGQSDGQCDRGTGTGLDPARGNIADPAAGDWFPEQASELVQLANPPIS